MGGTYRTVKLIQNRLYPTYQLHAFMANRKTAPRDGLRLAALSAMDWLRQRLGENAPEVVKRMPEPSAYQAATDDCLVSFHINAGFVIDVISLPAQGIWTLQITEPDLGSDPGNPDQARQAVPGRVIETNVGFKIVGTQLECGFQTVISDPEGTQEQAEVYRLAVVRRLIEHPDFGLKQITPLRSNVTEVTTAEQLKTLCGIWKSSDNHLPCVIFTYLRQETAKAEPPSFSAASLGLRTMPNLPLVLPARPAAVKPPYDMEAFAKYGVTYCRTYLLDDDLFERFMALTGASTAPGGIVVLEPAACGGQVRCLPYKPSKARQEETMAVLRDEIYHYPRNRAVDFGEIAFLAAAREGLLRSTEDAIQQSAETSGQWAQKLAELEVKWKVELDKKDAENQALSEQLRRQRQYQDRLEREKESLRQEREAEQDHCRRLLADKDEDIAYLKRKIGQPREHGQVAAWVEDNFRGRLLLHPKAAALLEEKSARSVNIELICDALDFLATDYWERRYARISTAEMNNRCSEKYGRPFEVKPTGTTTIEYTPAQYKIKYFKGAAGKPVESPLDYHLCVGNDPENLLRIYFLHDDQKKLIVVGSLPRHLKAVTIN